VFELAAIGLSNAEIAAAEHVSEATVKSQMTRVLAKTGARDRVQLAIIAHSRRLVQPHMTGRGLD
jgi:DNA-binding NarL/FixJ family response regulator